MVTEAGFLRCSTHQPTLNYTYSRFFQWLFHQLQVFSYEIVKCIQLEVQSIHRTAPTHCPKPPQSILGLIKQFTHHQVQKRAQSVAAIHLQSCDGRTVDPRVREQVTLAQPCRRKWTSTVSPVTIGVSPVKHTSPSAAQRSHDKFEDKNKNYVSFRSKLCTHSRICNKMHSTQ